MILLNIARPLRTTLILSVALIFLSTVTAAPITIDNSALSGPRRGNVDPRLPNQEHVNIRGMSNLTKRTDGTNRAQYVPSGTGTGGQYSKDQP
ncbi:hypothetical protein BGX21_004733, partial [Mortierella sp. AD011]